ncbi:Ligand-binding domain of nuclear hormone receptor [Aphelenchoides fujianensis]|nr:Ligand-binding domain of nuclear hormone receptor [Aphelenchoides fujianensis]
MKTMRFGTTPTALHNECGVCGVRTPSVSRHYGIYCCLGCKTFFRRAIVRKRRYFCEFNEHCDVSDRSGRQSCRFCRLQKCHEAGMRASALQGKRDSVGMRQSSREQEEEIVPLAALRHTPSPDDAEKAQLLSLITQLTADDSKLRARKADRFRSMSEAMKLARSVNTLPYPAYFGRTDLRMVDVIDMGCCTSFEMIALVEWAQTLPIFARLPTDVRTLLLRGFAVHQLIVEAGFCTAASGLEDIWLLPNGTTFPRNMMALPMESRKIVSADRQWRQAKLYNQMTARCIDDVATPMKRLGLLPQELVTLKVILLCQFGSSVHSAEEHEKSAAILNAFKDQVIRALFEFYKSKGMIDYEERFGNVLLLISGIVGAASLLHESYQIMRVFGIVPFDKLTNLLLFSVDDEDSPHS